MKTVTLNNGLEMPVLGFGVMELAGEDCVRGICHAVNAGYRLIDTAALYGNEKAVGQGIRECGISREELFITAKVWPSDAGYEKTKAAFELSLQNLGVEYMDLYLVHQPYGDYYGSWRVMEELHRQGKIKAIGVSNFSNQQLVDLMVNNEIPPVINQIGLTPYDQKSETRKVLESYNVKAEAWGPLGRGQQELLNDPELANIGAKYGKSIAQVILRWHIQQGSIVIPKSAHPERIKENFDIWDFSLSTEDMEHISMLDKNQEPPIDPQSLDMIRMICETKTNN